MRAVFCVGYVNSINKPTGSGNQQLSDKIMGSYILTHKDKRYRSPWNRPRKHRREAEVQIYSFFNLGARWRWVGGWVVNATFRPLYARERNPVSV
jgi:hypothetical protein